MSQYAPGEVTPEQLREYRNRFEAARIGKLNATARYNAAYRAYCDALLEHREAESLYVWAQQGMVRVGGTE